MRTLVHKALPAYAITLFALFFLTMLLYLLHIDNWDHEVILLITGAMIFYPFLAPMAVWYPPDKPSPTVMNRSSSSVESRMSIMSPIAG